MPRIAAVIPCLNEAPSVGRVVRNLREQPFVVLDRVIVVDNGSTDGTGEIACAAGADVVREERRGYGYACKAGVLAAEDADVIVLLDGDAADDPSDLPRILEPLLRDQADLVVGSRALGSREPGSMTPQQVIGNQIAAWLMGAIYGVRITDLGPFRAIHRRDLLALDMQEMTYGWSVEMMVKAARAGYRYHEVPVRYLRRIGVSKVGGTVKGSAKAGWCILATTLKHSGWKPPERPCHPESFMSASLATGGEEDRRTVTSAERGISVGGASTGRGDWGAARRPRSLVAALLGMTWRKGRSSG